MPLRIVILAKAPHPGQAKTRLIPALGAQGAAALAERMLHHTATEALAARLGTVELCRSPAEDPYWLTWQGTAGLRFGDQGAGDLGERMARAARRIIAGGEAVLLIGTDCPALDRRRLQAVADALRETDVVLVPARDGGYVALGLCRFHRQIFADIPWSTDAVAAETLRRIRSLGWAVTVLAPETDIDEPEDLPHLPRFLSMEAVDRLSTSTPTPMQLQ